MCSTRDVPPRDAKYLHLWRNEQDWRYLIPLAPDFGMNGSCNTSSIRFIKENQNKRCYFMAII
ncbi:hypothetical protein OKW21_001829 [Catalinimonas alkaloidigena]|uniref:hypothetical protein n=1 Tax=Catalinimonas alkaloidigena TaxID=1075417 RepID=UPI002404E5E1|nr:hypothetical protein [Catalinimonas alkaloidigena]MDF9796566.1 hypothetical protein [Catalinimonas alkaloidigena]